MTCHQGRASGDDVDEAIAAAGVGDDDVSSALGFSNIHYRPAAAILYAGQVRGGYQYADQTYDRRFRHVPDQSTCVGCHDPHTTAPKWDTCETCHDGVNDAVGARDIRMRLARQIFEREVHSFSSLSDAELHGLHRWIGLGEVAISELQNWLKANYGEQLPLI